MSDRIAFIGAPGASKSTQINMLADRLGPERVLVASVPRLVRGAPELLAMLTREEAERLGDVVSVARAARDAGELAPLELDEILFRAVARVRDGRLVAFDGCPRGLRQARLFITISDLARRTMVIHISFPANAEATSYHRQSLRETAKRGADAAIALAPRFAQKFRTFVEETLPGLATLRAAGLDVVEIDATRSRDQIHAAVMAALTPRSIQWSGPRAVWAPA